MAVASLDNDGSFASYSSTGSEIEIAAPGTEVLSATSNDGYATLTGTSMAAPIVTGVAALTLSQWSLTAEELRNHLQSTAVDMGLSSDKQGYGRVDAYEAVSTDANEADSTDSTVVDDFEDGDLSEYTFDRGSSGASVVTSPTHSGSYALQFAEDYVEAISTSGLDIYPAEGDTFSFWVRASGGANNINVTWGVQDHNNRYYAKLYPSDGKFYLFTYKDGSGSSQDGDSGLAISQDAWYEIEIDWATDGTQTATLYDSSGSQLSQISMTDATWSSGGIGYDAYLGSGEFAYFDYVNIGTTDSPNEKSIIDDFEDGDLSEYANASSSDWAVASDKYYNGSYAALSPSNFTAVYNNNYTYERGDTLQARSYFETQNGVSTGMELWFCTNSDATKKYVQYVSAEDKEHTLVYRNSIDQKVIDSETAEIPSDEWLRLEVSTDSSTVTANVFDSTGNLVSTLSGTDTELSSGGYGFKDEWRSENPAVYVDYLQG
jgi:hypothetical protein